MTRPFFPNAILGLLMFIALSPMASADAPYWESLRLRDHPLVGTVWRQDGTQSSLEELFVEVHAAHFILIGEKHDNPDHHALQARIIRDLVRRGRRPAIVMEMIPTDLQPELDNYLASEVPNSATLGAILKWEERGWPRWSYYEPIAEAALAANLPIYGGDLPNTLLRQLVDDGKDVLSKKQVKRLALDLERGPQADAALEELLYQSHCQLVPRDAMSSMADVQRARDGSLARTLVKQSDGKGGVLIAGNGHVRNDWGVPFVLREDKPGKSALAIGILEVEDGAETLNAYAAPYQAALIPFDYVVFTPAGEDIDYCARFKRDK